MRTLGEQEARTLTGQLHAVRALALSKCFALATCFSSRFAKVNSPTNPSTYLLLLLI